MPGNCTSLSPEHRSIAYDVTEVDIVRCVVKSEGRKEVRVQAFFVLKKDSNVKGRKQKSFSISKFGVDGAWARANRCKEFIEQLGRFPVDENEIEAFQGKSADTPGGGYTPSVEKENRGGNVGWASPYYPSGAKVGRKSEMSSSVRTFGGCRSVAGASSSAGSSGRVSKLGMEGVAKMGTAFFPCPPPFEACLQTGGHGCYSNGGSQQQQSQNGLLPSCNVSVKILEELNNSQLRYLVRFLDAATLSVVERCSKKLRQQILETDSWKLAFFTCIPHMVDLARLHVLTATRYSCGGGGTLSSALFPFPFERASAILFKGFLAFEHAVRHWVLWTDLVRTERLGSVAPASAPCSSQSCSSQSCSSHSSSLFGGRSYGVVPSFMAAPSFMAVPAAPLYGEEVVRCRRVVENCCNCLEYISNCGRLMAEEEIEILKMFYEKTKNLIDSMEEKKLNG